MSFPAYPEYKDSSVAWLGEVPSHWEVMQSRRMFSVRSEPALADDQMLTASQKYGVLFQSEFIEREGRRVVEVILGKENLRHVEPDDFIISMRSFQGGLEWCRLRGSTSFHYVMVTPVKHVHPPFFAHLFKSTTYIQALRATTDLIRDGQELRYSNFAQVPLPVVPFGEQQAIAAFLDRETAKIDALVAEQGRLIALLQEKRQAVISHAITKGLNPDAPMKDSGIEWLGAIPAHWDVKRLRHVADLNPSKGEIADWDNEAEVSFLPMEAIGEDGTLKLDRTRPITDVMTGYTYFRNGDVTIAKITPCFENGKGAVMRDLVGGIGFGTTELIVLRADQLTITPAYLDCIFRTRQFRALGEGSMYGAGGQKRVPDGFVRDFAIGLPPTDEQDHIVGYVAQMSDSFDALSAEAQSAIILLQERRAALISAAVTGKIDVRAQTFQSNVVSIDSARPLVLPSLRAVIGAYAIRELGPMGRMAVMKVGYLAEGHAGFGDLNGRYERYAAGPYDQSLIAAMERGAGEICAIVTKEPQDEGKPVTYDVPKGYQPPSDALSALVGEDRAKGFLALLSLLKGIGRDGVEAVATLYAVWNDLLAASKAANDDAICNGVLNDWHPEKAKKFKRADLDHWLDWMRRNRLVPDGSAPRTDNQGSLFT